MKTISVNVPIVFVDGLEELVTKGVYANRSEAIRVSIRDLLKRELYDILPLPESEKESTEEPVEPKKVKLKAQQYRCSICKINFKTFKEFTDHIKEEHPQINAESFIITV